MKHLISVLTKVLIRTCSIESAARELAMDTHEIERLCEVLSGASMALLPVSMDLDRRQIEYLDVQNATYEEPFLSETIERLRHERLGALNFEVSFEDHVQATLSSTVEPHAFIFHVGRCGSTLLSNMLGASPGSLVLKEPEILNQMLAAFLLAPSPQTRDEQGLLLSATLRSFAGVLSSRRLLLKTSAWNVRVAKVLLDLASSARAVFLYREPSDTVASLMQHGPGWVGLLECPRQVQGSFFPDVLRLAAPSNQRPCAFFAHAWNSMVNSALELSSDRVLFVSYEDMCTNMRPVLVQIVEHLRLPVDPDMLRDMMSHAHFYSKESGVRIPFAPEGRHRRLPLPLSQLREIDRITAPVATRLTDRQRLSRRVPSSQSSTLSEDRSSALPPHRQPFSP